MSSAALPADLVLRAQRRVLNLYAAVLGLMIIVIALLVAYAVHLGPLVGPGVETSFGLALAGLFIAGAIVAHVVDYTYRVWPEGRTFRPSFPGFFSDQGIANAIKVLILVAAAATIAYVIATLLVS